ncbi:DUF1697 domain-containing protein [Enterococcus sp. LJL99]
MKRYVALLRGINVGGKNKLSMPLLKKEVVESGFSEVTTYLNSGNIIFSSTIVDKTILSNQIKAIIMNKFNLMIPVYIISQNELNELLENAPEWWGDDNKEIYDNLIFMMPPLSAKELSNELGEPKAEYEQIASYNNSVFWSFNRKNYQKTNWWSKTATNKLKNSITIRTANTVKKISCM